MVLRYFILFFYLLGECIQREEDTSIVSQGHKNYCRWTPSYIEIPCCNYYFVSLACHSWNSNPTLGCLGKLPASVGSVYVRENMQDGIWSNHLLIFNAPFWCWWSLWSGWSSGKKKNENFNLKFNFYVSYAFLSIFLNLLIWLSDGGWRDEYTNHSFFEVW